MGERVGGDTSRGVAGQVHRAGDVTVGELGRGARIGVKKLRYDLELAEPAFAQPIQAMLARLEPLQELLGDLHDADVHLPIVEKFVARADAATQPGGLRLLRDEIDLRDRLAVSLEQEVTRFTDEKILEQLREQLC